MVLALAGTFSLAGPPVAAHTHVTVGTYELTVGWRVEPAVAGALNGLDLGILNGTQPVFGANDTLTTTLSAGPASVPKDLEPQFGRDGWYTFDVIPTRPGAYSVRLVGTLGTTAVDVVVTLDDVGAPADFAFPDPDPTARDLQAQINSANAIIAGLQSSLALALGIALVGVIVGGIGVALGWRISRKARKAQ
jgi:hypothetical protein